MQPHHDYTLGGGEILHGLRVGFRRVFLGVAAVQTGIPQAIACADEHAALCFGECVAAALVGGNAGRYTGQQRQTLIGRSQVGQHIRSCGFAVRLQQKRHCVSFRRDPANQIVIPLGCVRRQEERRLSACVMQVIQDSRRIFIRRTVIGKVHADRLFRRFLLYLWDFDGVVVHFRCCRSGIGIRVAVAVTAVRLGCVALVIVDRVFDHLGVRRNERGVALRRAVRNTQYIFALQGQRRIGKAELGTAQLDRHIHGSVHLIRRCGIAVQILIVHIAFRSRKAERFAVCGKIEHAVIL